MALSRQQTFSVTCVIISTVVSMIVAATDAATDPNMWTLTTNKNTLLTTSSLPADVLYRRAAFVTGTLPAFTKSLNSSDVSSVTVAGNSSSNDAGVFGRYTWTQFLAVFCPLGLNVDRYVTPVWYVLGICGNIISARLWMTRKMRRNNSSAVYLAALAVSDTCFLLLHVVQELRYAWDVKTLDFPVLCETYFVLYLWAQYLSPLLVLGFTTERWIAVCKPFLKERFCTEHRALCTTAALGGGALFLCLIQSFFWTYDAPNDLCRQRIELQSGLTVAWSAWTWTTELLIFLAVPLVILVFNVFVIAEIRRLTAARMSLVPTVSDSCVMSHSQSQTSTSAAANNGSSTGGNSNTSTDGVGGHRITRRANGASSANKSTTLMLLYVSFYVILTTLPATLVYALYQYFPGGDNVLTDDAIRADATWRLYLTYIAVRKVVEEVCLSHYACNFILYVTTGPQFRKAAVNLFDVNRWCHVRSDMMYIDIRHRSATCVTSNM
jgi:hypothetical protein